MCTCGIDIATQQESPATISKPSAAGVASPKGLL